MRNLPSTHRADEVSCPCREGYIQSRGPPRGRVAPKPAQPLRPSQQYHQDRTQQPRQIAGNNSSAVLTNQTYAEAVSGGRPNQYRQRHSPSANHNAANTNSELLSMGEITDIIFNAAEALRSCTTRLDQLKVIASILEKCV